MRLVFSKCTIFICLIIVTEQTDFDLKHMHAMHTHTKDVINRKL